MYLQSHLEFGILGLSARVSNHFEFPELSQDYLGISYLYLYLCLLKIDIYKRKITSAINYMNADWYLVQNSFLALKDLVKNWLLSMTHLNEQIIDAFIENEADAELTDKENEEEVCLIFTLSTTLQFLRRNLLGPLLKLSCHIFSMKWLLN